MGKEYECFTSHLVCKLVENRDEKYSKVINWIRTRWSLRAVLICVQGTRSSRTITGHYPDDFNLANFYSRVGYRSVFFFFLLIGILRPCA